MSFLTLDAVTKRFDDIVAVDSVSCRTDRGEVVGFLGPNGRRQVHHDAPDHPILRARRRKHQPGRRSPRGRRARRQAAHRVFSGEQPAIRRHATPLPGPRSRCWDWSWPAYHPAFSSPSSRNNSANRTTSGPSVWATRPNRPQTLPCSRCSARPDSLTAAEAERFQRFFDRGRSALVLASGRCRRRVRDRWPGTGT